MRGVFVSKPELVNMNPVRVTVGILFVVFAARMSTPAMAKDVEQPASICRTDAPELNATVPVSEATAPAPALQGPASAIWHEVAERWFRRMLPSVLLHPMSSFLRRSRGTVHEAGTPIRTPADRRRLLSRTTTFLSTSDLDFNFDPGLRATVGMRLCGCRALEFSYFGLFQGNASARTVKPDPGAYPYFPE